MYHPPDPDPDALPALVLSGGRSSRMGVPKALLRDTTGDTFVVRIVHTLLAAGIQRIAVVTGPHHDVIAAALDAASLPAPPTVIRNPDPSRGQLSSLLSGMTVMCHEGTQAILVTLVDVPLVSVDTVVRVADAWRRSRAPIVRPAFGNRRGHPVVFDRAVFDELRSAPLEAGARVVVRAHSDRIVDVPVDDPGCIADVDTPDDYRQLIGGAPPGC